MSESYARCPHCGKKIDMVAVYDVAPSDGREKTASNSTISDPDSPASDAQYRKMFAIWHNELHEDPASKPPKGMTRGQAHEWIEKQ